MGSYTKPLDLYHAQRKRFEALQLGMKRGHLDLAVAGLKDAQELTAGTLTAQQTRGAFARGTTPKLSTKFGRRRDIPRAELKRRGLRGAVPLLPINMRSGRLHGSFVLRSAKGAGVQSFELAQQNPGGGIWSIVPGGTRWAADRGFFPEIRRRWRARNKAFIDHFRSLQAKP